MFRSCVRILLHHFSRVFNRPERLLLYTYMASLPVHDTSPDKLQIKTERDKEDLDCDKSEGPPLSTFWTDLDDPKKRILKTCFLCDRTFLRGTNLRQHLISTHRLDPSSLLANNHDIFDDDSPSATVNDQDVNMRTDTIRSSSSPFQINNCTKTPVALSSRTSPSFDDMPSMAMMPVVSPVGVSSQRDEHSGIQTDSVPTESQGENNLQQSMKKPIKMCPWCHKTFTRNTNLRRHIENDVCKGGLITWESKSYQQAGLHVSSSPASGDSSEFEENDSKRDNEGLYQNISLLSPLTSTSHGNWTVSDSMTSHYRADVALSPTLDTVQTSNYPHIIADDDDQVGNAVPRNGGWSNASSDDGFRDEYSNVEGDDDDGDVTDMNDIPVVIPSDYIPEYHEENLENLERASSSDNTAVDMHKLSAEEVATFQQIENDNPNANWKLLSCNICRQQFQDVQALLKHLIVHRDSEKNSNHGMQQQQNCILNDTTAETATSFDRRLPTLTISSTDMTMQINCGEPVPSRPRLSRTCHICHKVFSRTTTLRRHMVVHQKTYKCNNCARSLRKDKFIAHLRWCGQTLTPTEEGGSSQQPGGAPERSSKEDVRSVEPPHRMEDGECSSTGNICTKGGQSCKRHKLTRTCHICYKVFSRTTTLRRHMSIHNRKKVHECRNCGALFPEGEDFEQHLQQCHPIKSANDLIPRDVSNVCTSTIPATCPAGEEVVQVSHSSSNQFRNEVRKDLREDHEKLSGHLDHLDQVSSSFRNANGDNNWLNCHICGKIFARSETLRRHMITCEAESANQKRDLHCVTCGRNFFKEAEYAKHAANCYGKRLSPVDILRTSPPLKIEPIVSVATEMSSSVNSDMKSSLNVPPARQPSASRGRPKMSRTCPVCQKTFSRTTVLRIHIGLHQDRPVHTCERCQRSFHGKAKYDMHRCPALELALMNSKQDRPKNTTSSSDLSQQLNTHLKVSSSHSGSPADEAISSVSVETSVPSKKVCGRPKMSRTCEICHKTFSRTTVLRKHMSVHENKQDFKCHKCGVTFHKKALYLVHLNICKKDNMDLPQKYDNGAEVPSMATVSPLDEENNNKSDNPEEDERKLERANAAEESSEEQKKELSISVTSDVSIEKGKKSCGRPKLSRTCHICHKTFSRTTVLRKHMSVHEEKPLHECDACGWAFRRKNHLTAHMLKCMGAMQLQYERDVLDSTAITRSGNPSPITTPSSIVKKECTETLVEESQREAASHTSPPTIHDREFPMHYPEEQMDQMLDGENYQNDMSTEDLYDASSSINLMQQLEHISSTRHRCYKCYACFDEDHELEAHVSTCIDGVVASSYENLYGKPDTFKHDLGMSDSGGMKGELKARRNRNIGC